MDILKEIQTEEEYDIIISLSDYLADQVGDNKNHPLYKLFDKAMGLIEAWEVVHVRL